MLLGTVVFNKLVKLPGYDYEALEEEAAREEKRSKSVGINGDASAVRVSSRVFGFCGRVTVVCSAPAGRFGIAGTARHGPAAYSQLVQGHCAARALENPVFVDHRHTHEGSVANNCIYHGFQYVYHGFSVGPPPPGVLAETSALDLESPRSCERSSWGTIAGRPWVRVPSRVCAVDTRTADMSRPSWWLRSHPLLPTSFATRRRCALNRGDSRAAMSSGHHPNAASRRVARDGGRARTSWVPTPAPASASDRNPDPGDTAGTGRTKPTGSPASASPTDAKNRSANAAMVSPSSDTTLLRLDSAPSKGWV